MFRYVAALAACAIALGATTSACADAPVTLDDALARVMATHPDLRVFDAQHDILDAGVAEAMQRPALTAGAEVENVFGNGHMRGLGGAEWTLSLASVLERGGKLDARRALARSEVDALATQREKTRLDLLAETARRYLDVVAARGEAAVAQDEVTVRQRIEAAARKRHRAGGAPASVWLAAQAALATAELDLARARQHTRAAGRYLAAMWGDTGETLEVAADKPFDLPKLPAFADLAAWLEQTPELTAFVDQRRIGQARLQLANSRSRADLTWTFGVKHLAMENDTGLMAGISIPLGGAERARPGIRAARAGLEETRVRREAAGLSLRATLAEAYGRYDGARLEVRRLDADVLPRLAQASQSAAAAWRGGAASYLEWSELETRQVQARQRRWSAAITARQALIEIQRLTGQAFVVGSMPTVMDSAATSAGNLESRP